MSPMGDAFYLFTCHSIHGCPQDFFSRGGQVRGTKALQRGPGVEPWWGSGAKPPEADDRLYKKLCYREEHSASVLFRWNTLSHLQSTGVSLCGLAVKSGSTSRRLGLGLPLVGVAVSIELGLGLGLGLELALR